MLPGAIVSPSAADCALTDRSPAAGTVRLLPRDGARAYMRVSVPPAQLSPSPKGVGAAITVPWTTMRNPHDRVPTSGLETSTTVSAGVIRPYIARCIEPV